MICNLRPTSSIHVTWCLARTRTCQATLQLHNCRYYAVDALVHGLKELLVNTSFLTPAIFMRTISRSDVDCSNNDYSAYPSTHERAFSYMQSPKHLITCPPLRGGSLPPTCVIMLLRRPARRPRCIVGHLKNIIQGRIRENRLER